MAFDSMTRKCRYCHQDISAASVVCEHCGKQLIARAPGPAPSATATTQPRGIRVVAVITALVACLAVGGWAYQHHQTAVDKTKLEAAYRAAKTIQGATKVGVNYLKLMELLQQFQTEISIASDKKPGVAERAILEDYTEAAAIYTDSMALWKQQIEHSRYLSDYGDVQALKTKYGLPVETTGTIDSQTGIQLIWVKAALRLDHGSTLYSR